MFDLTTIFYKPRKAKKPHSEAYTDPLMGNKFCLQIAYRTSLLLHMYGSNWC